MGWGWSHPNLDCTHGFFIRAALRFWTAAKAASLRKEQLIFLEKKWIVPSKKYQSYNSWRSDGHSCPISLGHLCLVVVMAQLELQECLSNLALFLNYMLYIQIFS